MIPYSTCIRFGASRRREWLLCTAERATAVIVEGSEENILFIKVYDKEQEKGTDEGSSRQKPSPLSQSEYNLLQGLEVGVDRPVVTGQFLTLQRKRSNLPILQPWQHLLNLLDNSYYGISECLLMHVNQWAFNTFALDVSTGGRSMPILLVHLFHKYGFVTTFKLDVVKVWHCFNLIEAGYHSSNPYHNSVHAADVTQAMHCFLQEDKIKAHMTPVEAMASLIAAVAHDLDHPGVNQPFLIATSNHLAALYKNFSVLENHHWRSTISCLKESGIFDHLEKSVWDETEDHIRSLILATDITRQQEFLTRFKRYLENNKIDMQEKEYRHFILQIALKCADLCNPCRPWDISHRWSLQVCKEFYRQGDYEKKLCLPVTPICDRTKTTVAKIQADFFKFVVSPLFEIWDQFLDTPLSKELLFHLRVNHQQWKKEVEKLEQHKKRSESLKSDLKAPLASEEDEGDLEDEEYLLPLSSRASTDYGDDEEMRETFTGPWGRRHSMPLSIPKILPRTIIRKRRQSLPQSAAGVTKTAASSSGAKHRTLQSCSQPVSLRTFSAESLLPRTSILSLSSATTGAQLKTILRTAKESDKRLVHQPLSYPPYIRRTSEPSSSDYPIDQSLLELHRRRKSEASTAAGSAVSAQPGPSSSSGTLLTETKSDDPDPSEGDVDMTKSDGAPKKCTNGCCTPPAVLESPTGSSPSNLSRQSDISRTGSVKFCDKSVYSSESFHDPVPPVQISNKDRLQNLVGSEDDSLTQRESSERRHLFSSNNCKKHLCFSVDVKKEAESGEKDSEGSWCQHISRSLSEERSSHPHITEHTWKPPSNNNRRSSEPGIQVSVEGIQGLRGRSSFPRRWSIPSEPANETSLPSGPIGLTVSGLYSNRSFPKELVRRHSISFLETFPLVRSCVSDIDNSVTETSGTTCGSSDTFPETSGTCEGPLIKDVSDTDVSHERKELFLRFMHSSPNHLRGRRGSLPADIPLSTVRCVPPAPPPPPQSSSSSVYQDSHSSLPTSERVTKRRGSTGEILCALIGPLGTIQTLQEIAQNPSQFFSQDAAVSACSLPRRGSGGMELFSGFWRSRTSDWSPGSVIPPQPASAAGKFKLQRQGMSLESAGGCSSGMNADHKKADIVNFPVAIGSVMHSHRRGSFPLDLSLFCFNSEERLTDDGSD